MVIPGRTALLILLLLIGTATAACLDGGDSKLAAGVVDDSDKPFGPRVRFDPLALPVPEIPFPNDLLLRPAAGTASGAAWNLSIEAPTHLESEIRRMLNGLDGFGVNGAIFVSFEGPLDLSTVTDTSIRLVNIEPGHPEYGDEVLLDLGRGYHPISAKPSNYWGHDPRDHLPDLLFPDGNDADTDGDGDQERVTHYEVETHTLVLHPVIPLAPGARHAVLLTRELQGWTPEQEGEGAPASVRSPFPFKAHVDHVAPVAEAMSTVGLTSDDLAFGWVYTTSDMARPLLQLRAGVHGQGPLARMGQESPPGFAVVRDTDVAADADQNQDGVLEFPRDHTFILQGDFMASVFGLVGFVESDFELNFDAVDYFVVGSFHSPDVRTGPRQTIGVNTETGTGEVNKGDVPFLLSVPRTTEQHAPPFPVMVYFHGTSTSRMEVLAIANSMAQQGIASLSFDQVGHGPIIPDILLVLQNGSLGVELIELLGPQIAGLLVPGMEDDFDGLDVYGTLDKLAEIGFWRELAHIGRTTDENGDGALESGESFFFADPFRMCASFWQDLVDFFHIVATLRGLDPDDLPSAIEDPAGASEERLLENVLAGDFNADGVLDVGGPDVQISVAGTSLGGFHAAMAAALEPEVTVATPIVAGGGLSEIIGRSSLHVVTRRLILQVFGPLVVGCPDGEGGVWLSMNNDSKECREEDTPIRSFARVPDVAPGTSVTLENLDNGEKAEVEVNEDGGFSLAVAADRWDQFLITVDTETPVQIPILTPYEGTGYQRNSPEFRRFAGMLQHVLDRCDPMGMARHLFRDPLPGHPPVKVLYELAAGDTTVPISSGINLALASGAMGENREDWGPIMETLIQQGAMTSGEYDVDDLLGDNPPESPPVGPLTPVASGDGLSSVRFAYVDEDHEWIAVVDQNATFDPGMYSQHQIAIFHASGGTVVADDLCIDREEPSECPAWDLAD
ncbi:MAG: hypothetical protein VX938_04855 [Myxococcota bacterium]|nr:hypothetical protein [Myxococcota bacterium]